MFAQGSRKAEEKRIGKEIASQGAQEAIFGGLVGGGLTSIHAAKLRGKRARIVNVSDPLSTAPTSAASALAESSVDSHAVHVEVASAATRQELSSLQLATRLVERNVRGLFVIPEDVDIRRLSKFRKMLSAAKKKGGEEAFRAEAERLNVGIQRRVNIAGADIARARELLKPESVAAARAELAAFTLRRAPTLRKHEPFLSTPFSERREFLGSLLRAEPGMIAAVNKLAVPGSTNLFSIRNRARLALRNKLDVGYLLASRGAPKVIAGTRSLIRGSARAIAAGKFGAEKALSIAHEALLPVAAAVGVAAAIPTVSEFARGYAPDFVINTLQRQSIAVTGVLDSTLKYVDAIAKTATEGRQMALALGALGQDSVSAETVGAVSSAVYEVEYARLSFEKQIERRFQHRARTTLAHATWGAIF